MTETVQLTPKAYSLLRGSKNLFKKVAYNHTNKQIHRNRAKRILRNLTAQRNDAPGRGEGERERVGERMYVMLC